MSTRNASTPSPLNQHRAEPGDCRPVEIARRDGRGFVAIEVFGLVLSEVAYLHVMTEFNISLKIKFFDNCFDER